MSNYETIKNKIKNGESSTIKVSSPAELKELFNVTEDVATAMKEAKGSTDVGAAMTRNILLSEEDTLPAGAKAQVTVSALENVIIGDGCQWVIPKDTNQAIALATLTLGTGASIKSEHTTLSLTVENLKYQSNVDSSKVPVGEVKKGVKATYHFGIFGSKGVSPQKAASGDNGSSGADGKNSECGSGGGTPIGGVTATNGSKGGKGKDGGKGADGGDGKPSMPTMLSFEAIDASVKSISIFSVSGAGGNGADGGDGGKGGKGGKGGNGSQCGCTGMDAANGGDGGDGGNGGDGGDGGNGVNGMPITITVPESFDTNHIYFSYEDAAPGSGGSGGKAGHRGEGGERGHQGHKYSSEGSDGKEGTDGKAGTSGKAGTQAGIHGDFTVFTA